MLCASLLQRIAWPRGNNRGVRSAPTSGQPAMEANPPQRRGSANHSALLSSSPRCPSLPSRSDSSSRAPRFDRTSRPRFKSKWNGAVGLHSLQRRFLAPPCLFLHSTAVQLCLSRGCWHHRGADPPPSLHRSASALVPPLPSEGTSTLMENSSLASIPKHFPNLTQICHYLSVFIQSNSLLDVFLFVMGKCLQHFQVLGILQFQGPIPVNC